MRFVWLIALLVLAAAAAAVMWPRGVEMPQAPAARSSNAASPSDMPTAAPREPEQPSAGGLSELLPAAKPAQAKAELTMGAPPVIERVDERTVRLDGPDPARLPLVKDRQVAATVVTKVSASAAA